MKDFQTQYATERRNLIVAKNKDLLYIVGIGILLSIFVTLLAIWLVKVQNTLARVLMIVILASLRITLIFVIMIVILYIRNSIRDVRLLDEIKHREVDFTNPELSEYRYLVSRILCAITASASYNKFITEHDTIPYYRNEDDTYPSVRIWRALLRHGYHPGPIVAIFHGDIYGITMTSDYHATIYRADVEANQLESISLDLSQSDNLSLLYDFIDDKPITAYTMKFLFGPDPEKNLLEFLVNRFEFQANQI